MPFGLWPLASTTFQRAMDVVLMCYFDNVILFGRDFNELYDRLKMVLERLRSHHLRAKLEKCRSSSSNV